MKGSFADISRVLPKGDEACEHVCVHVRVSVSIEAKGTAEKVFLVLQLVPTFSYHLFVPMTYRRAYASVWGVQ